MFEVSLIHEVLIPQPSAVLREVWKVTLVKATDSLHCFDIELRQQALTDQPLVIKQYHYGGMAVRGPVAWLLPKAAARGDAETDRTGDETNDTSDRSLPVILTNDIGSDRQVGNHQPVKWVRLTGPKTAGGTATIVAMSHASNFRGPQPARLHPDKPYFCFTPCVEAAFTIDQQHDYTARYRFYVMDEPLSDTSLLSEWHSWHAETK